MDAIFALAAGPGPARVLERAATRIPGCLYIFLWAPVIAGHQPSSHLRCVDAWISSGGGGDRAREVFKAYRQSFCAIVSGCVPGWAYKDGRSYMELPEPDHTASASLQVQQQFYHEAGTKTAVFMGCDHGEIEVGLSSAPPPEVANNLQQSLLEEFVQLTPAVPSSSSSSSLPSLSIGSPEYSSLIRSMPTMAAAGTAAEPPSQERQPRPLLPAVQVQLPGLHPPVFTHAPFLSFKDEDAAIAEAMLAVISCSAPQPPAPTDVQPPPPSPPWLARHRAQRCSPRHRAPGAFRAYSAALSLRARPRPGAPGQRMAKTAIAFMLSVHMAVRDQELATSRRQDVAAGAGQPHPAPQPQHTSSQLHHMISERRRRERLNESFQTLRALLPPGSKKDKATVLANTKEYMHKLITDISDLEKKNRKLEAQVGLPLETQQQAGSHDLSERVQVDVTTGASTLTSTSGGQARDVSIRVTVRAECNLPEVVNAILARIKKTGRFAVVTVDARQGSSRHAQVSITLRVTVGKNDDEADETSLKEAVAKAVEDAVARRP